MVTRAHSRTRAELSPNLGRQAVAVRAIAFIPPRRRVGLSCWRPSDRSDPRRPTSPSSRRRSHTRRRLREGRLRSGLGFMGSTRARRSVALRMGQRTLPGGADGLRCLPRIACADQRSGNGWLSSVRLRSFRQARRSRSASRPVFAVARVSRAEANACPLSKRKSRAPQERSPRLPLLRRCGSLRRRVFPIRRSSAKPNALMFSAAASPSGGTRSSRCRRVRVSGGV